VCITQPQLAGPSQQLIGIPFDQDGLNKKGDPFGSPKAKVMKIG
jgi:hypothetical protein